MWSTEADFAHAILEVVGPAEDLDLDAHEVDRQVTAVNLGEADGVLLRGDDRLGLLLLAAVDDVEDFLLGKAVVVRELARIDQFAAELDQALLEALRLRNAAQGSHSAAFEESEARALAGEDVLQVKGVMV